MLTDPVASARTIGVDGNIRYAVVRVVRGAGRIVAILEEIAAHDARIAIVVGQREADRSLVSRGISERDHVTARAMTTLVVMVIDKHKGVLWRQHAPTRIIHGPINMLGRWPDIPV